MNDIPTHTPFEPVFKEDAARLLHVTTKTINNCIIEGLLPAPSKFGGREMWLPELFYSHLRRALTPTGASCAYPDSELHSIEVNQMPPVASASSQADRDSCAARRERVRQRSRIRSL